jgi:flagellar motor switch protein FliM
VQPVALVNSEGRVRGKLTQVEAACAAFSERFGAMLTRARKTRSTIVAAPPAVIGKTERESRLAEEGVVFALQMGEVGVALLHVSAALVFESVDRYFGGAGEVLVSNEPRRMSALELKVARQLALQLITELNGTREELWPELAAPVVISRLESIASLIGKQALLALSWTEPNASPAPCVSVFLPSDAVKGEQPKASVAVSDALRASLASNVSQAPVDLVVELGQATLDLGQLLALSEGQVVRLDRASHDHLDVRVRGECVLTGAPSAEGSHLAFTIANWR